MVGYLSSTRREVFFYSKSELNTYDRNEIRRDVGRYNGIDPQHSENCGGRGRKACLQAVDYFVQALQRLFERHEEQYVTYL